MSVRASASLPSSCSGDMYWNVPRIGAPLCQRPEPWVGTTDLRPGRGLLGLGQPEIEQLHAGLRQHDVAGLQVSMHDSRAVCGGKRVRDLRAEAQRLFRRQRSAAQAVGQRIAVEILHDEILDALLRAHIVQRADVRMGERRDRPRLALEALAHLGVRGEMPRENLDRHRPVEARVLGFVDLAHPPGADGRENLVRPELRSGGKSHRPVPLEIGKKASVVSGNLPVVRGANSLPTGGREEVRAAGAKRSEEVRPRSSPFGRAARRWRSETSSQAE